MNYKLLHVQTLSIIICVVIQMLNIDNSGVNLSMRDI